MESNHHRRTPERSTILDTIYSMGEHFSIEDLGDGIYTISTLTSQQVEHIIGYACDKGYKRFAILSQDNATG